LKLRLNSRLRRKQNLKLRSKRESVWNRSSKRKQMNMLRPSKNTRRSKKPKSKFRSSIRLRLSQSTRLRSSSNL